MFMQSLFSTIMLGLVYYVMIAFIVLKKNVFDWPWFARAVFAVAVVGTFTALLYNSIQ